MHEQKENGVQTADACTRCINKGLSTFEGVTADRRTTLQIWQKVQRLTALTRSTTKSWQSASCEQRLKASMPRAEPIEDALASHQQLISSWKKKQSKTMHMHLNPLSWGGGGESRSRFTCWTCSVYLPSRLRLALHLLPKLSLCRKRSSPAGLEKSSSPSRFLELYV